VLRLGQKAGAGDWVEEKARGRFLPGPAGDKEAKSE